MEEKNSFGRIKEKSQELRREVKQRIVGYIVGALGLVAGLAWNDAIRALIEYVFPMDQGSVWAKFIYAALVSVILIVAAYLIVRWAGRDEDKAEA